MSCDFPNQQSSECGQLDFPHATNTDLPVILKKKPKKSVNTYAHTPRTLCGMKDRQDSKQKVIHGIWRDTRDFQNYSINIWTIYDP